MKTYEEVKQILAVIEPTEDMYTKLSLEDLPHLQRLLQEPEPWRAARAVYAAARLQSTASHTLVFNAASDARREVRAAAAIVAPRVPVATGHAVIERLLDDNDVGIKKLAINSIGNNPSAGILSRLKALSESHTNTQIKLLASKTLASKH